MKVVGNVNLLQSLCSYLTWTCRYYLHYCIVNYNYVKKHFHQNYIYYKQFFFLLIDFNQMALFPWKCITFNKKKKILKAEKLPQTSLCVPFLHKPHSSHQTECSSPTKDCDAHGGQRPEPSPRGRGLSHCTSNSQETVWLVSQTVFKILGVGVVAIRYI